MTETPSWATEKAREIAQSICNNTSTLIGGGDVALLATALSLAYQQGKQDGQREMKERAARIGYRVCAETRHVTLGDAVGAAIRRLDEVQDA